MRPDDHLTKMVTPFQWFVERIIINRLILILLRAMHFTRSTYYITVSGPTTTTVDQVLLCNYISIIQLINAGQHNGQPQK